MKKVISLLLVLTMALCLLVSCNGGKKPSGGGNVGNVDDANIQWPANIGDDIDYDGYEFRILTTGGTGGDHWSAREFLIDDTELKGDVINEAVKTRDAAVNEKLNIKISYIEKNSADLNEFVRTSVDAGDDAFDLASPSMTQAATLAQEGRLLDLNDYKDILNLDADYWDKNSNDQISIENHLFFALSNLTLVDKQATWVVYFTKSMLEKYPSLIAGYDSLYDMVEKGDWTIEKMSEMVNEVSHDLNGDNEMTDVDQYGHIGEAFNLAALMTGCGSKVTEKNASDIPEYTWEANAESLVTSYEKVESIVSDSKHSMLSGRMQQYTDKDIWTVAFGTMMEEGRVLFNVTGMNRCRLYRGLETNFGIVPLPKANKEQEKYQMLMTGAANCVVIPITCSNDIRTCTVLEALTACADQTTYHAYIEQALKIKELRDDDSAAMLDIIFNNRVIDSVDLYFPEFGSQRFFQNHPNSTAIVSAIRAKRKQTENAIEKRILAKFRSIYDKVERK